MKKQFKELTAQFKNIAGNSSAYEAAGNILKDIKNNADSYKEADIRSKVRDLVLTSGGYDFSDFLLEDDNIDLKVNAIIPPVSKKKVPIAFIETKSVKNTVEMITQDNLNKRALHEIITYFFKDIEHHIVQEKREYTTVKWLIVTNGLQWFIFPKSEFVIRFLASDDMRDLLLQKKLFHQKKEDIYNYLYRYFARYPEFLQGIQYYYLDASTLKEKQISALVKFFNKDFFVNEALINEKLSLNKKFYDELLYIMGLQEQNHKIISTKVKGSFYNQLSKLNKDWTEEDKLDILVVWLNRILFLKLFEARLIEFNKGSSQFAFMNTESIIDFPSLNNLFFQVLATNEDNRYDPEKFKNIPYLNSSLFELSAIEKETTLISSITNEKIKCFKGSVTGEKEERLLTYLFAFLDSYNFGNIPSIDLSTLISPAVLGLIFEKINGYKDGSYYTPSEITDYMADDAIKKSFVLKVNKECGKQYKDYKSFATAYYSGALDDCKETIKKILDTITVIDPAVGSGHFLVSALNVLLKIKWDLGLLTDNTEIRRLYDITKKPFDIIAVDKSTQDLFIYHRPGKKGELQQEFQKLLFDAKKKIIENNLFGVDINPKAVEIARLRLWIELLKNAYYTEKSNFTRMETLPNIDINIKKGDSLLAPIVDKHANLFVNQSNQIVKYKQLFSLYQNTPDKSKKFEIKEAMEKIRNNLVQNETTRANGGFVWAIDFPQTIDSNGSFIGFDVGIGNPPYGIRYNKAQVKGEYLSAKTVKNGQKGSTDSYILFTERGIKLLARDNGVLAYIVPMSIISSESSDALHQFIKSCSSEMYVSSYSVRPKPVFESAVVDTSIIEIITKKKPNSFNVFTTKMYRSTEKKPISSIIKNLEFIEVNKFYRMGRYPKISKPIERCILEKVNEQKYNIGSFIVKKKEDQKPIYYRTAGGRYFKIITPYSTGSSKEKPLYLAKKIALSIGAIMSSSLFFWYYQIFSDNLDLKLSDIVSFGIPYNKLDNEIILRIEKAYQEYLTDIEKNIIVHDKTNYANINSYKEYKIKKSKIFIDKIDDIICPLYGMTEKETDFIKTYDIAVRMQEYKNT